MHNKEAHQNKKLLERQLEKQYKFEVKKILDTSHNQKKNYNYGKRNIMNWIEERIKLLLKLLSDHQRQKNREFCNWNNNYDNYIQNINQFARKNKK